MLNDYYIYYIIYTRKTTYMHIIGFKKVNDLQIGRFPLVTVE